MKRIVFVLFALMAFVHVNANRPAAKAASVVPASEYLDGFSVEEKPTLPAPVINIEEEYEKVIISASGEGIIHLYVNGQERGNPFPIYRSYDEIFLAIEAVAEADGWESSSAVLEYVVIPIPIPEPEITSAPSFSGRSMDYGYAVTIEPTEPSTIYYRVSYRDETKYEWICISDWMVYDGKELVYSTIGHYRIEAYAVADGKNYSEWVGYEFYVWPDPIYDFEEAGIFYKITGEGKVSVCTETTQYDSYSGYVTIPATVTHEGVTYMVSAIYSNAFYNCNGLMGVTIGPNVTAIGDYAFDCCRNLTSVTMGDYVINVGAYAFYGCTSLTSVTLGSGVAWIGDYAFWACDALTTVNCKAATPPSMASSNCFGRYNGATLHVYPAVLARYQSATNWSRFSSIVGEDNVAPAPGDTNGDGVVNITDVTALINMLLRGEY